MRYSDYIIYADESGDPNPASVDANYPVFVLNFCVFRKDHYAGSVLPAVAAFKFAHFGHDAVVLHEQDIYRGKAPFDFDGDSGERTTFKHNLDTLIAGLDFGIISTVIDKSLFMRPPVSDFYGLARNSAWNKLTNSWKSVDSKMQSRTSSWKAGAAEKMLIWCRIFDVLAMVITESVRILRVSHWFSRTRRVTPSACRSQT